MRTLQEIAEELLQEIKKRKELRNQMVGQLYPSIVFEEECKLMLAYKAITTRT